MIATSLVDIYTTLMSWRLYTVLWDILNGTGLAYIPFIVAIISSMKDVYENSPDKAIAKLEMNIFGMIIVLMLVVIPYMDFDVELGDVQYSVTNTSCNVADATGTGDATGKAADTVFSDFAGAGQEGNMPVAWALVQYISSSVTYTTIKQMGCAFDHQKLLMDLSRVTVRDDEVANRLEGFAQQCYKAALSDLEQNGWPAGYTRDGATPWQQPSYIGSEMFLKTPGRFYNAPRATMITTDADYDFSYEPATNPLDAANPNSDVSVRSCAEVWESTSPDGLRELLFKDLSGSGLFGNGENGGVWLDYSLEGYKLTGLTPSNEQKQDMYMATVLSANAMAMGNQQNLTLGTETYEAPQGWTDDAMDAVTNLIVGGVAAWDGASTMAQMAVVAQSMKTAVPILISVLQMLVVIIAPMAMVWGNYKLDNFIILALGYFGLEFLNAIMQLGYYFENKVTELAGAAIADMELTAAITGYVVAFLQLFLLPSVWLALVVATGSTALKGMQAVGASQRGNYGTAGSNAITSVGQRAATSTLGKVRGK